MKIIYLCQMLPYPLDSGGNIHNHAVILTLLKLKHKVTIFSFVDKKNKLSFKKYYSSQGCSLGKIIVNPLITPTISLRNRINKFFYLLINLFSPYPFSVAKFKNHLMKKFINNYLQKNKVDCIWIDNIAMAQYAQKCNVKFKVLFIGDIHSEIYKTSFALSSSLIMKLFALHEWLKFIFYEKKMYKKFNKIITISDEIKKRVKNSNNHLKPVTCLPYIHQSLKNRHATRSQSDILFVGTLFWYPNKDGINWFFSSIFPILFNINKNFTLSIVGEASQGINFPKLRNIKYYGYQNNIEKIWRQASIFIVPIRYGGGIRMKILEAMTHGIPIISTRIGIEGLKLHHGSEILIADDCDDFAYKINELLNNNKLRLKLIQNGYKFLINNFSENQLLRKIRQIL